MTKNVTKEVATLLGVELEEEFKLDGLSYKYKLSNNGLMVWSDDLQQWHCSIRVGQLLTGERKIIKLPKPILDDVEKEYLSNIIKPFRDRIAWVRKFKSPNNEYLEYIKIAYRDDFRINALNFPDFRTGEMYRGMEINKPYTLKELGL